MPGSEDPSKTSDDQKYYESEELVNFKDMMYIQDGKREEEFLTGDEACHKASAQIEMVRTSEFSVKSDYNMVLQYVLKLSQTRRGFYCSLCDADSQETLANRWNSTKSTEILSGAKNKLFFGTKFCNDFSSFAVSYAFYIFHNFKKYIDATITLLACQSRRLQKMEMGDITQANKDLELDSRPVYRIDPKDKKVLMKCKALRSKKDIFACKEFCEWYDLTAPRPKVDGDIEQTRHLVTLVIKNRNLFDDPNNNSLVSDIPNLESRLFINWNSALMKTTFFTSTDKFNLMNHHNTVVLEGDGLNPFDSTADNVYPMKIESGGIWDLATILVLCGVLFKF